MTVVEKSVLIECTPAQMFALVDAVEDYPVFLPWCGGSEVFARTEHVTEARIDIVYRGIKSFFATRNDKEFPQRMRLHLLDGPFTRMEGHWNFIALGEQGCKIEFCLHYEFSSATLAKIMGSVFNQIAQSMVDSFVTRARQLYG
jgi:ribosome-associated toxin RatA of RatAB toxin-antitoxin module